MNETTLTAALWKADDLMHAAKGLRWWGGRCGASTTVSNGGVCFVTPKHLLQRCTAAAPHTSCRTALTGDASAEQEPSDSSTLGAISGSAGAIAGFYSGGGGNGSWGSGGGGGGGGADAASAAWTRIEL